MTGQTGQIITDNEAVAQVTWRDGRRGAGTRHTDGTLRTRLARRHDIYIINYATW